MKRWPWLTNTISVDVSSMKLIIIWSWVCSIVSWLDKLHRRSIERESIANSKVRFCPGQASPTSNKALRLLATGAFVNLNPRIPEKNCTECGKWKKKFHPKRTACLDDRWLKKLFFSTGTSEMDSMKTLKGQRARTEQGEVLNSESTHGIFSP